MEYYLVIDIGTTYIKTFVYDKALELAASARAVIKTSSSADGFAEQDANQYFEKAIACAERVVWKAGIEWFDIESIGISNQRATTVIFDRNGNPLLNAITWQDGRTANLYEAVYGDAVCGHTGRIGRRGAMTPALALAWIRRQSPTLWGKLASGEVLFGTPDTWMIYKLTKGRVYAVSFSNVGAFGCYDCKEDHWYRPVLKELDIDAGGLHFPEVKEDLDDYGKTAPGVFPAEIPIKAVFADQQADMFASNLYEEGAIKCAVSSGIFIGINAGNRFRPAPVGLKNQNGWKIGGETVYLFEGQGGMAGSVQQWALENLSLAVSPFEIDELAGSVPDSGGVVFIPALTGLAAPFWNSTARGAILGLSLGTGRAQIVRAMLEGIAFRIKDILDTAEKGSDPALKISVMRLGGGMTKSDIFCRILANITGVTAIRYPQEDLSSFGVAMAMTGQYRTVSHQINKITDEARDFGKTWFEPESDESARSLRYDDWRQAVACITGRSVPLSGS